MNINTYVTCAVCKREELHQSRGLCNRCYCWARGQGILYIFPTGRRAPVGRHPRAEYWREYKRSKHHGK